jgi:hypothetical protein
VAFALMAGGEIAFGQSLDEIEKRDEAVRQAWEKTPFTMRRALFVTGKPGGFGVHDSETDKTAMIELPFTQE